MFINRKNFALLHPLEFKQLEILLGVVGNLLCPNFPITTIAIIGCQHHRNLRQVFSGEEDIAVMVWDILVGNSRGDNKGNNSAVA